LGSESTDQISNRHWISLLCLIWAMIALGQTPVLAQPVSPALLVGDDCYLTEDAAKLARQARGFDPMFCTQSNRDRDRATALYAAAIAAQPGAKVNAKLANRIAQLYAFYEDAPLKIKPDTARARQWWQQCVQLSDRKQLLWAEAHMGLAGSAIRGNDLISSIGHYKEILDVDEAALELPNWKLSRSKTGPDPEADAAELQRLRGELAQMKLVAVGNAFGVASAVDSAMADALILHVEGKYHGTELGNKAKTLRGKAKGTGPIAGMPELPSAAIASADAPISAAAPQAPAIAPFRISTSLLIVLILVVASGLAMVFGRRRGGTRAT
jgi:hypothetical protein